MYNNNFDSYSFQSLYKINLPSKCLRVKWFLGLILLCWWHPYQFRLLFASFYSCKSPLTQNQHHTLDSKSLKMTHCLKRLSIIVLLDRFPCILRWSFSMAASVYPTNHLDSPYTIHKPWNDGWTFATKRNVTFSDVAANDAWYSFNWMEIYRKPKQNNYNTTISRKITILH